MDTWRCQMDTWRCQMDTWRFRKAAGRMRAAMRGLVVGMALGMWRGARRVPLPMRRMGGRPGHASIRQRHVAPARLAGIMDGGAARSSGGGAGRPGEQKRRSLACLCRAGGKTADTRRWQTATGTMCHHGASGPMPCRSLRRSEACPAVGRHPTHGTTQIVPRNRSEFNIKLRGTLGCAACSPVPAARGRASCKFSCAEPDLAGGARM